MRVSTCGFLIVIAIILTNIVTEATREPERIVEVVYIEIPTQQEQNPTEDKQEPQSNKKSLGYSQLPPTALVRVAPDHTTMAIPSQAIRQRRV